MPGLMPHSRKLAEMGRGGDTEIGHLTEGEVVLPPEVAGQSDVRRQLLEAFSRAGIDIGRYTVGGEDDSINPRTGMREYYGPGDAFDGPGDAQDGQGGGESGGGFGDGGDHHDAGAVSSGDASGPGPGGGGERGREGGMYGGGANQAGAPSASATGGDGVTRDDVPSRASPGGGYHGPGGAIDSGYTLTGPDNTGYNPGTLGFWESQNPTRALMSRGLAALVPFMSTAYSMLDRDEPLRSPSPYTEGENDGGAWATASKFLPPAAGAASAAGPAGSQYTGFYTPPPDPNIPSWQRYLDVTS